MFACSDNKPLEVVIQNPVCEKGNIDDIRLVIILEDLVKIRDYTRGESFDELTCEDGSLCLDPRGLCYNLNEARWVKWMNNTFTISY